MASVLIVDDSAQARQLIKQAVAQAKVFDRVLEASDGIQGLKFLLEETFDIVICDLEMDGFNGEKLLRARQSNPGGANLPFIVVTGSDDVDRRTSLLENGASDVLTKPFHPPDLVARLLLHLKIKRLQDELLIKNETLSRLSAFDSVTGLRSRRYVSEVLSIEFLRARRYQSPLSVIMADLDHFKQVNDRYGHPAGDAVLRGVSGQLLGRLRATDVGGRYGGEEILVILHQSNLLGAATLAERWRHDVETAKYESPDGRLIEVRISLGIAQYDSTMSGPDDLIQAADDALYRAKAAGRNCVEMHVVD